MTFLSSKTCFKCNTSKPLSDFYKHSQMADGHLNKCKDCAKKDVRAHREENLDKIREYDRTRGRTENRKKEARQYQAEHPEIHLAANRRYKEKFPEKNFARVSVNNAIRDGRLFKQPCEVCGDPDSEGHHDDYSKPLDVRWLCDAHHKEHHRNERELQRQEAA